MFPLSLTVFGSDATVPILRPAVIRVLRVRKLQAIPYWHAINDVLQETEAIIVPTHEAAYIGEVSRLED